MVCISGCQPSIPNSAANLSNGTVNPGRGVGFDNSLAAERARRAERAQTAAPAAVTVAPLASTTAQSAPPGPQEASSSDPELTQIAERSDAAAAQANSGEAVVNASPSNAPPPLIENPGLSNETDFEAVSSRRTIESDAARLATNRAQYTLVRPTDLPTRTDGAEPNLVEYALQTQHPVGQKVYTRFGFSSPARTQRNCASYASSDDAQADFLARGGPRRDSRRLDPDGDGYACSWDPGPLRRAAGG